MVKCYRTISRRGGCRGPAYCEKCGELMMDAPSSRKLTKDLPGRKPAVVRLSGAADHDGAEFERESVPGKPAVQPAVHLRADLARLSSA
jgi:hypothetical protein